MQIYAALYDVVSNNMATAGQQLEYQKTTFLCDVTRHSQTIDVSQYLHLENSLFLQAIYVAAYKRLPETNFCDKWESQLSLDKKDFQTIFLKHMTNTSVVAINHIRFINNPYFQQHTSVKYKVLGVLYGLTTKSSLREFGKKLPQPIQKIIRKIFI
ncbi:MAG: hypothetical protein IJZ44_06890 [Lachnospiraceae bacterium]|nr:hypothetical protein [Lachnospiraceae bacterium]